ncbi:hypothetical protein BB560_003472 [Smittium megazygosporum]|uniref:Receptor L-domain domain-containing protein n=1 Tax=Smittium megazygosporum TaxID=133381 RepID=A0A2T9ZBY4_9FUNG|nr:hypothetical protein BB560_003472 [Smittium megazygosporum]
MKLLFLSALLALVAGQCDEDITISSESDLSQLSGCNSYSGQITVSNYDGATLDMSIKSADSIVVENSFQLAQINFGSLTTISKNFQIQNNTQLLGLSIPKLSSVDNFQLINNPNLNVILSTSFSKIGNYQIIQSQIVNLIPVSASTIKNIEIIANSFLIDISFPSVVNNTGYINIVDNHSSAFASFDSLTTISGNTTFRDLAGLRVDNVTTVSDTFNVYENTFTKLDLSQLSTLSKDLSIANNTKLDTIKIPGVSNLGGGLQIIGNSALTQIENSTFTTLSYIKGGVSLSGPFDNITFPALTRVDGAFKLNTTGTFSCNTASTQIRPRVKGSYSCTQPKSSTTSSGSSGSSNSPASSIVINRSSIGAACITFALIAATLFF